MKQYGSMTMDFLPLCIKIKLENYYIIIWLQLVNKEDDYVFIHPIQLFKILAILSKSEQCHHY
jgi:hypothetical protein